MNSETTDSKVLTLEKHIMSTVKQSSPILKHSKLPNTNLVTSFGLNILVTKLFYSRNYYSHPKTNTIYFFFLFFFKLILQTGKEATSNRMKITTINFQMKITKTENLMTSITRPKVQSSRLSFPLEDIREKTCSDMNTEDNHLLLGPLHKDLAFFFWNIHPL